MTPDRRSYAPSERSHRTPVPEPDRRGGGKLRRPRSRSPVGPRAASPNPSMRHTIVLDDPDVAPLRPLTAYAPSGRPDLGISTAPISSAGDRTPGRRTIVLDDPPPSAVTARNTVVLDHPAPQRPGPGIMQPAEDSDVPRRMTSASSVGSRRSFVTASGYGRYDPDDDLDPAYLATPLGRTTDLPSGPAPGSTAQARTQAAHGSDDEYGYGRRSSRWVDAQRYGNRA
jgi:hypothetical protein